VLAYAVTERGETGKHKAYAAPGSRLGVRLGSRTTYAAPRVLLSKSRIDTRTQTEGLSSYRYRLYSTLCQADTKCTSTRKATDPTSTSTSIESQEAKATSTTSSSTIIESLGHES
jgi:hypothetical protein